jgi:hypothetical protein
VYGYAADGTEYKLRTVGCSSVFDLYDSGNIARYKTNVAKEATR